jgi:hypothetical protein
LLLSTLVEAKNATAAHERVSARLGYKAHSGDV